MASAKFIPGDVSRKTHWKIRARAPGATVEWILKLASRISGQFLVENPGRALGTYPRKTVKKKSQEEHCKKSGKLLCGNSWNNLWKQISMRDICNTFRWNPTRHFEQNELGRKSRQNSEKLHEASYDQYRKESSETSPGKNSKINPRYAAKSFRNCPSWYSYRNPFTKESLEEILKDFLNTGRSRGKYSRESLQHL